MLLKRAAVFTVFSGILIALVIKKGPKFFRPKRPENFGGFVRPGFEKVQEIFKQNFEDNLDFEGAAFSVCHKGEIIIDLWGGYANSTAQKLWKEDTMTMAFSVTKAMCSLSLALLVDRGHLKYDDLVTMYWPEFGKHNKSMVTVRMLATHQAALAYFDQPITHELIGDWRKMSEAIENTRPNWPISDERFGYHAFTFGFIVDQLVRRVDPQRRSIGRFFHEEIAAPHGIDFYIGLPDEHKSRVAQGMEPSKWRSVYEMVRDWRMGYMWWKWALKPPPIMTKIFQNAPWVMKLDSEGRIYYNDPAYWKLEVGSANGIGTARALAKLFCLLRSDALIGAQTRRLLFQPIFPNGFDSVLELPFSAGHGFLYERNPKGHFTIGHWGYGGQIAKFDPEFDLSFGYVRNGMTMAMGESLRTYTGLQRAVYDVIVTTKKKTDQSE